MSTSISDLYGTNSAQSLNAVYEDADSNTSMSIEDFFSLMIAELKNQDFTDPVDSSEYVSQLAQFSVLQEMQTLSYYSQTNYVMGLVGKNVTVASYSLGGDITSTTGTVEKVSLSSDDYEIYVDGNAYSLSQIMSVNEPDVTAASEMSTVSNMTPYLLSRTANSAEIAWNAPETEDETQYYYKVYYSEDEDFDTVAEVKQGTLVDSLQGGKDALEATLSDLDADTTYYVNVIISTSDGDEAVYEKLIFNTRKS